MLALTVGTSTLEETVDRREMRAFKRLWYVNVGGALRTEGGEVLCFPRVLQTAPHPRMMAPDKRHSEEQRRHGDATEGDAIGKRGQGNTNASLSLNHLWYRR